MTTQERHHTEASWLTDLTAHAHQADTVTDWPGASLELARQGGVLAWGIPARFGGQGLDRVAYLEATERLASACLTTAFILSQREAAVRWLIDGGRLATESYLPALARGELFATVGLSQLTTSRQHRPPSLVARPVGSSEAPDAYRLDGEIPWVTGADQADAIIAGAALGETDQLVVLVPGKQHGLEISRPLPLAALAGSRTAAVRCSGVEVPADHVLAGPGPRLVRSGGGLDTSCLALGLARAAIEYLRIEANRRPDFDSGTTHLEAALTAARGWLHELARTPTPLADRVLALRVDGTRLALRATQAALAAAKGSGFVVPHGVQRWVRQALFFLVWSCPQPVAAALFTDLAAP